MNKKMIYFVDAFLLVGTAIAIMYTIGYVQPLLIAPTDDYISENNTILFSFENAKTLYVDEDINFSSPIKINVNEDTRLNLKPGIYYWKVEGISSSEIRKLTILSIVDLQIKQNGAIVDVINTGTVALNVSVYNNESLVNEMVVGIDERARLNDSSNNSLIIGRER